MGLVVVRLLLVASSQYRHVLEPRCKCKKGRIGEKGLHTLEAMEGPETSMGISEKQSRLSERSFSTGYSGHPFSYK